MLELIKQWGDAAEKGGPWFLVAILGAIIFFGGRWLYGRGEDREAKLRGQVEELQKAAIEREKKAGEDKAQALKDQDTICEERYDALRDQSREEHNRRNDEIKEVAVTMTVALQQEAAAKHLAAKASDEMANKLDKLTTEVRDLRLGPSK